MGNDKVIFIRYMVGSEGLLVRFHYICFFYIAQTVTLFFFYDFVYLFEREKERARESTSGEEREKQAPH